MAERNDLLDKLYVRDLLRGSYNFFATWLPRINERLQSSKDSTHSQSLARLAGEGGGAGWAEFFKSWFAIFGTAVLMASSPLVCAYIWHQFWESRFFQKKQEELVNTAVVVTGCDSGIGIETAAVLSGEYPSLIVIAGCLTTAGVERLASLQRQNLVPLKLDVTSDADIQYFVNIVRSRLGNRKLYAIVNNAGVFDGCLAEITPVDVYRQVIEVNLLGAVRMTKALLPMLMRGDDRGRDGGRIVTVTGMATLACSPGNTAYCASKSALAAFNDGLRQELREVGIRVIQVSPGPVRTAALNQIRVSVNTLLAAGSQEVLERCGGQRYITAYSRFIADVYDSAPPPIYIARTIQRALIRKYPKDIYFEHERIYNLLSLCPHFIRDFLMDCRSFRNQIISKYLKKEKN